jgi:GntR family transcriptional regulator
LSRRGRGPAPWSSALRKAAQYVHETASVEQLLEYAADVPLTVSMTKPVRAGPALARQLDCPEGDEWMFIAGLRRPIGSAVPTCWTEVYLRAEYADMPRLVGQTVGPIFTWIETRHGQVITDIEQLLTARAVPARIAAKLGVPPCSPGVEMRRTFRLGNGRIGQIAVNLHPADRFRYAIKLKRASTP